MEQNASITLNYATCKHSLATELLCKIELFIGGYDASEDDICFVIIRKQNKLQILTTTITTCYCNDCNVCVTGLQCVCNRTAMCL